MLVSEKKKTPLTIRDPRWMAGIGSCVFQKEAIVQEFEEFDPFKELQNNVICSSCKYTMDADCERDIIINHYMSQWHRFNVKRISQGKQSLTEEDYENILENDSADDTSDDDDSENSGGYNFETGSLAFFTQNENVYSIYRAILDENERQPSQEVFIRPLNCAILLLAGGHFAGAVFENGKMTLHKTVKRYVIRAKQGKAQSASDSSGVASSAGSSLRRHNEKRLKEEIGEIISEFKKALAGTPLIFIRCASYQKSTFYIHDVLEKNDPRIRNIPFATKRPTLAEIKKAWERLHVVHEHGTLNEFDKFVELLKKKQLARKNLQKKKKPMQTDIIEDSENSKRDTEERKKDHLKLRQEEPKEDFWPEVPRSLRTKLYDFISANDVGGLRAVIEESRDISNEIFKYLNERKFAPGNFSFLHEAASNGLDDVLQYLLDLHCDPSVQDCEGRVPFALCFNKKTKSVFVNFRAENPTLWSYGRTHIPEIRELTEEEKARQEEKKREKKQKQREKQKEKKAQMKEEAEESKAKTAFLNLSEREKRAMAAEARLGVLSRCVNCGNNLPKIPFEYEDVKLCTPACVAAHRTRFNAGPKNL